MEGLPKRSRVAKLKEQDKELEGLPDLDTEKEKFLKGESLLKRWTKPKKVTFDLKNLAKKKKKKIGLIKKAAGRKKKPLKRTGRR